MRKIKFLSVSALNQFETQPNKFYCTRLAEERLPRDPQSLAAAAGTQFDINVKRFLIENGLLGKYKDIDTAERVIKDRFVQFPWYQPLNEKRNLDDIFLDSLEPQNRVSEIFTVGEKLFHAYIKSELFKKTEFYDVENRSIFELKIKLSGIEHTVPIYTILDTVLLDNNSTTVLGYPMDLKVSGYASGASPKKGYVTSFDSDGNHLGEHKDHNTVLEIYKDFSVCDLQWATQACTYGWSIGRPLFEPFPAEIHALYLGKPKVDGSRSIKVCGYRGIITSNFQKMVALRFVNAWNTINSTVSAIDSNGDTSYPWSSENLIAEMLSRTESWY